ncbi:transcription initiation factor [Ephemerocybe angulata]|uniref:Transcription initiation factor n=1 Tax=Ephemerocybe angulata TaxID=980116 RepID=A0A8H6ID09_9AGAR|nr:transcription initiation factor [Tulosesus angulatus]
MAPKAHSMSLLFHPKKKQNKSNGVSGPVGRPTRKQEAPVPAHGQPRAPPLASAASTSSLKDEADEVFQLPNTPYSEFRILSSKLQGWKYDVMKFDSRKPVDIMKWRPPIKLNRKDLRKDDIANIPAEPQAVGPMLGPDGKPVIGMDGRMVMVDAEGRPIHGDSGGASGSAKDKGKGNAAGGRKRFQKKTRQVFLVPDEVRQLRKEERYPWVMEDSPDSKEESWVGHLEEVSKAETHGFFMPAANDAFKFVPAHRWYKFQKKLKHDLPTATAEMENLYTQSQKKDPQAWLATFNGGRGASSATAALFKQEGETKPNINDGQSLAPGGRKLKTVDSGAGGLFDDDDDDDSRKRRAKELGGEGDLDEQVYEEDFADDEEHMNVDEGEDEEQKEIEERLKREYQRANKQNDTGMDEHDDDEDSNPKNKQQKALEKMIKNHEGNNAYESDEEMNPYASSAEEEEEEPEPVHTGPAIIQPPAPPQNDAAKSPTSTPKPPAVVPHSASNSRATSPLASPSLGGHSLMAKRATSPKIPKAKMPGASAGSRGNSPSGSRANSPTPSRATSPLANSANGDALKGNKRKADDSPTSPSTNGANGVPKPKKKKVGTATQVSAAELEALLITWLKNTPNATTRDCIQHFNSYLTDAGRKVEFSGMVKRVALLKNGVLGLRPGLG